MRIPALVSGLFFTVILTFPSLAQSIFIHKETRADGHFEEDSYYKAGELYRKLIKKNPYNDRARLKLARTYFRLNKPDKAELYYSQVIHKKYLVKSLDYLHYAQVLQLAEKFKSAENWAKRYLAINPRNIIAQNLIYDLENVGKCYQDSSRFVAEEVSMVKGTLLVVSGTANTKSYVITENQVIEIKDPGTNNNTNWLSDLLDMINIEIEQTVNINPIHYAFDKASIDNKYITELDKLAWLMNKYDFIEFELEAHTDALGSDIYNQQLSQQRVNIVMEYLRDKHVESERLLAVDYGESNPINACKDKQPCVKHLDKLNRRTEFRLIYIEDDQVVSNY